MFDVVRTTLTLDDDVARELQRLQEQRREPFRQTVNFVLRAGFTVLARNVPRGRKAYRTEPVSLGSPRLKTLDDISEVLAFAEGEEHRYPRRCEPSALCDDRRLREAR